MAGIQWREYDGYTIKLVSIDGLQHENLIQAVDSRLTKESMILILVYLQVELLSRTKNKHEQGGMVYANPAPPLRNHLQHQLCGLPLEKKPWPHRRLGTLNLPLHNEVRKRARKSGNNLLNYERK